MDKTAARKHLQMIVHHANGTAIQVWSEKDKVWYDSTNPSFREDCIYRVKPVETEEEKSLKAFRKEYWITSVTTDQNIKKSLSFIGWEAARKYYKANKE